MKEVFLKISIINIPNNLFADRRISPNGKAAVLKTAGLCPWGFESLILRHFNFKF